MTWTPNFWKTLDNPSAPGGKVDMYHVCGDDGSTAVSLAVPHGDTETAKFLCAAFNEKRERDRRRWNPMSSAPRQEKPTILLLHRVHGVVEGSFSDGYWIDATPDHPREYTGSSWICGDDAFQEEVEELPPEQGGYHDGCIIGWLPRDALPTAPEEQDAAD